MEPTCVIHAIHRHSVNYPPDASKLFFRFQHWCQVYCHAHQSTNKQTSSENIEVHSNNIQAVSICASRAPTFEVEKLTMSFTDFAATARFALFLRLCKRPFGWDFRSKSYASQNKLFVATCDWNATQNVSEKIPAAYSTSLKQIRNFVS